MPANETEALLRYYNSELSYLRRMAVPPVCAGETPLGQGAAHAQGQIADRWRKLVCNFAADALSRPRKSRGDRAC